MTAVHADVRTSHLSTGVRLEQVLGTVLVGALGEPAGLSGFAEVVNQLRDPVDAGLVREFQVATTATPLPADELEVYVRESRRLPARIWQAVLRDFVTGQQPPPGPAPTLLVWGERDGFADAEQRAAIAAANPDAGVLVHPGVGHAAHREAPHRFTEDPVAFVARTAGALR